MSVETEMVNLTTALRREETARRSSVPFSRFQYVSVTFAAANQDTDIPHTLQPDDPDSVRWMVVGTEGDATTQVNGWDAPVFYLSPASVYRDNAGDRRAWTRDTLWLRSQQPGTFRLLVFLEA